jgi:hypothetical protein
MAQHRLAGAWNGFKQSAKHEWGHLPDGRFEELERRHADREIDQWSATMDQPAPASHGR